MDYLDDVRQMARKTYENTNLNSYVFESIAAKARNTCPFHGEMREAWLAEFDALYERDLPGMIRYRDSFR
jgi:ribosome modulation factor